ncbi:Domain of uncharacterised function (DUF1833) [Bordetella trematum]|uniref:DUF1833 family protein n=1 Tax=Bordetella trematum TaxID=123899 RepID=UPI0007934D80|nr:DUF1833 family protein [Bordetella trematum]SAI62875.1 Domain of uncharacterised function (DUF1833) [Bordetella trematum]
MTILSVVYASAPDDEVVIPSLEISVPGLATIRICAGFEDHELGVDGQLHLFEAGSLQVALPASNTTGQQTLTFGVANVNGVAQRHVDAALEAGERVALIYREYLASDKSAPARRPLVMTMTGGQFSNGEAQFEAGYYDLLNAAWPRQRYTVENAPGLKYMR